MKRYTWVLLSVGFAVSVWFKDVPLPWWVRLAISGFFVLTALQHLASLERPGSQHRWRNRRGWVALLAVSIAVGACRPAAEGNPMPVVVEVSEGQYTVLVPVCAASDGVVRFDVSSEDDDYIDTRGTQEVRSERLVRMVVSDSTLRDGSFNDAEVRVLAEAGGPITVDDVEWLVITTTRGFAQWSPTRSALELNSAYLVIGDRAPVSTGANPTELRTWCG